MYRWFLRAGFGVVFLLALAPAASAQTPPPTCAFSISPTVIERGASARLLWQSTNSSSASIVPLGNVATTGSQTVNPSSSTTYYGSFAGPGGTTTCQVGLAVYRAPGTPYSPGTPGVSGGPSFFGGGGGNTAQSQAIIPNGDSNTSSFGSAQSNNVPLSYAAQSPGGLQSCTGLDCNLCSFGQLIQNIINFLIGLSIPIAVIMFAWAGILYFTSSGDPARSGKAKKIFGKVFLGFVIALTGWLVVQTVLSVLVKQSFYIGGNWKNLQCADISQRPMHGSVTEFLGTLSPYNLAPVTVMGDPCTQYGLDAEYTNGACRVASGAYAGAYFCPDGYSSSDPTSSACTDAAGGALPSTVSVQVPNSHSSCNDYGLTAQQSCIASYESSCNPGIGSGVDVGTDGKAVSWGLFQINLSANPISCGGQTLDCPSAFGGGTYTAKNDGTYVVNNSLYNDCVAAARDVQCNAQMQQQIYASQGINAWGNAARKNCTGL